MKAQENIEVDSGVRRIFSVNGFAASSFSKYEEIYSSGPSTTAQEASSRLFWEPTSDASGSLSFQEYSFPINELVTRNLREPISITLEPDDGGFIARSFEFPLYGYGESANEAITSLKAELESLYDELIADDEYTDDWLKIKSLLLRKVADG